MHILLIEPDKILSATYRAVLEQNGHSVSTAVSAQSAVHAAEERTPDLVVLELQLRGHSGIEFLYEFRSYVDWHAVPVMLHTLVAPQALEPFEQALEILNVTTYAYKPTTTLKQLARLVDGVPIQ